MKCECGKHFGISDFLVPLDKDQLLHALQIINDLLDKKNLEKKIPIFRVCDDGICYSNHLTFDLALSAFSRIASSFTDAPRELSITRQLVIESEVNEFCDEYKSNP